MVGRERVLSGRARVAGAASVWMMGTFLLCYLLLPVAQVLLGVSSQSIFEVMITGVASALAFLPMLAVVVMGIVVLRPRLSLNTDVRDTALAATAGGLLIWTILHNTLPGLIWFGTMELSSLLSFIGANIIESALFGVMLASVVRTARAAFTLGLLFQGLFLLLSYGVMMMMV